MNAEVLSNGRGIRETGTHRQFRLGDKPEAQGINRQGVHGGPVFPGL